MQDICSGVKLLVVLLRERLVVLLKERLLMLVILVLTLAELQVESSCGSVSAGALQEGLPFDVGVKFWG